MKQSIKEKAFPDVLVRIKDLGRYVRIARKRRKLPISEVAERLNIGYRTVVRIENGDPKVSVGAYMSVLWLFGLDRQLAGSVHPDLDETGKGLELSRLPERVRAKSEGHKYDF